MQEPPVRFVLEALGFAAAKHEGHTRKGQNSSPYIHHPIDVAVRLARAGVSDPAVLAAALLHDVVEDTDATLAEVGERFGSRVRDLVDAVTDDKGLPQRERKRQQELHAPALPPGAKLIKIADKTSNARDVGFDPPRKWTVERRREYLDWGERVVAGCRGVNAALEASYEETLAAARARVEEDAAEEAAT
jgi:guanosine-3',5'-bis(diphosphate) 3'-pyrophosphohydrolase